MKRCPTCAEKVQNGATICRFCNAPQPPKESAKPIWIICGVVLAVAAMAGLERKPEPVSDSPAPKPASEAIVAPDAVSLMRQDQYPKMYARLGKAAFHRANDKMTFAANKASRLPSCARVDMVGVSDQSTPSQIQWFVDCPNRRIRLAENGDQFIVTEDRYIP